MGCVNIRRNYRDTNSALARQLTADCVCYECSYIVSWHYFSAIMWDRSINILRSVSQFHLVYHISWILVMQTFSRRLALFMAVFRSPPLLLFTSVYLNVKEDHSKKLTSCSGRKRLFGDFTSIEIRWVVRRISQGSQRAKRLLKSSRQSILKFYIRYVSKLAIILKMYPYCLICTSFYLLFLMALHKTPKILGGGSLVVELGIKRMNSPMA